MDAVDDVHDGPGARGAGRGGPRRSSRPPACSPESCRGWPSWRCRTTTAGWRRPGSWCCPARSWPPCWRRARSASLAPETAAALRSGSAEGGRRPRHVRAGPRGGPRRPDVDAADAVGRRGARPAAAGRAPPASPPLTAVRDLDLVVTGDRALPLLAAPPAEARADVLLGGVPVPSYLPGGCRASRARRPAARPAAAPGRHGATGTVRTGPGTARGLELLRPPATRGRGARRRRRRARPARPARRPGPQGAARRCCGPSTPGWPRRSTGSTSTRRTGSASPRTGWRRTAVVLDAPYLLPLVDEPVVPAGGRPGPWPTSSTCRWPGRRSAGSVTARGRRLPWAELPGAGLAAARLGPRPAAGRGGRARRPDVGGRPVPWWPAATSTTSTGRRTRWAAHSPGGRAPGRCARHWPRRSPSPTAPTGSRPRMPCSHWPHRGTAWAPGAWPWSRAGRRPGGTGCAGPRGGVRGRPAGEQRQPVLAGGPVRRAVGGNKRTPSLSPLAGSRRATGRGRPAGRTAPRGRPGEPVERDVLRLR